MIRYCPKCKKDETRGECKYGQRYWDTYSLTIRLGKKYTTKNPQNWKFSSINRFMKQENYPRN